MYVSRERSSIVTRRGVEGAPDLVIDIRSDSTESDDRGAKMNLHARHEIGRYWIVDVDARCLEIYALRGNAYVRIGAYRDDTVVRCDIPAGLELQLTDVWAE